MGQTIEIIKTTAVDRILVIDTDRSIAGQDGVAYNGVEAARRSSTFPGKLAVQILEADSAVDHVFVMSNTVSVRRMGSWDAESIERVSDLVVRFFHYYE